MALLSNETKTNVGFKKLVGRAQTSNDRDFFAENIPTQISIDAGEVLGNEIPKDPATATSNGIAEYVEAELSEITASNGLAFNLLFPSGYNGNFGSSVAGNLIRSETQVIAQKNNLEDGKAKPDDNGGYAYDLKDGNGNPISFGADEGWQIDPVAGVLASEEEITELTSVGGTVGLYVFTGNFLSDSLGGTSGVVGSDTEVIFNNSGSFGADPDFTFDGSRVSVPALTLSNSTTTTSAGDLQIRKDSDGELSSVFDANNLEARYEGNSAFTLGRRIGSTTGGFSMVLGEDNEASGQGAIATGANTEASGDSTFATGDLSTASAEGAFAGGIDALSSAPSSVSIGEDVTSRGYGAASFGIWNEDYKTAGTEPTSISGISNSDRVFQVGAGDNPGAVSGDADFSDGRGRTDALYTTYRSGTYVRHGLQLDSYNSGTSSYERVLRFGSSIDATTNPEDIQLLARDPTNSNIVEYITGDDLINTEVNVIGGTNINTSFDAGTDEYTVNTDLNPEFSGVVLFSPDGTAYQTTVTDEGNLQTAPTGGTIGATAAQNPRLSYDNKTLEVQADTGQTAPLFRGDDENDNSVFEVGPQGEVSILEPGKGVVLTSPSGNRYRIKVKDDGTIQSNEI